MKTMTKFLTVALLLITSASFAQVQVALGLKGGVNISKADTDVSTDNVTGINAGAFALFKLTKIGIQPEVLFSQQGAKYDVNKLETSYINIPVMVKLYLAAGLNIQAGPQFGFLSKAEIDGANVKDSFKGSDLSANIGLGWDLPFGLLIDARYNIGLSDLDDSGVPAAPSFKNRVIQLSIGYKLFKIGN
ncbi:MAG: PorT family protein [Flammeovirgaceae bacterium]|nr:PorT family protein [Flammeovirgaceae bacterium]